MEIKPCRYTVEDRNLNFEVINEFQFRNRNECYYLRGGNGFGKTSFLEKIIIPALKTNNIDYLYIGQDIRTQLHTLRALLSILGHKVFNADEFDILKLWIKHSQSAKFFILDEFDKYYSDYGFIFDWSNKFIETYIIVTHLGYNQMEARIANYQSSNVRFEQINFDGRVKNIRVKKE